MRDDVAPVRETARDDERAAARHEDRVRGVRVAGDASCLRQRGDEGAVRHHHGGVGAAVVRHVEGVGDRHPPAVHLQARCGPLREERVVELVASHRETFPERDVSARHAKRGLRHAFGRVVRVAVVASVHEPLRELHVAAHDLQRRVDLLRPIRRPSAHARVVGVADQIGAAVLAEDELAFKHVEAAEAFRGGVAVWKGNEPALDAVGVVGERAGLAEARGARTGEVERAGAGLHERTARLHEVGGEREVVADVVDRGLRVDRRVVRERAVRPAAFRSVVAERAGADGDETGFAEARRRARRRHAVRDERAAAERGGGRVGVLRVEVHDAAAACAGVDAHGRCSGNGGDVRLDAVSGMDHDIGGKHSHRQAEAACRQAKEALRARFHPRDILPSADILPKIHAILTGT